MIGVEMQKQLSKLQLVPVWSLNNMSYRREFYLPETPAPWFEAENNQNLHERQRDKFS